PACPCSAEPTHFLAVLNALSAARAPKDAGGVVSVRSDVLSKFWLRASSPFAGPLKSPAGAVTPFVVGGIGEVESSPSLTALRDACARAGAVSGEPPEVNLGTAIASSRITAAAAAAGAKRYHRGGRAAAVTRSALLADSRTAAA